MDTEISELIEHLHTLLFDECDGVSDAVLSKMRGDDIEWIVERLRVLSDDEYSECAYGDTS